LDFSRVHAFIPPGVINLEPHRVHFSSCTLEIDVMLTSSVLAASLVLECDVWPRRQ
jgi:hypothetical protein